MEISIHPLQESELATADYIFRLAFGTFIGLAEPTKFAGDANYIQTRYLAEHTAAFAALLDGELVGSILATNWGSFGFFGPLSVRPNVWNQGISKKLISSVMEQFTQWGIQHQGLFTFPSSAKHHWLYQKFDFWPRFLTMVMVKAVYPTQPVREAVRYSTMSEDERCQFLRASFELTNTVFEGLDLSAEIRTVHGRKLGDTIGFYDAKGVAGFAVCHYGAGTEAGSNTCYVKFGTVRPGIHASERFEQLLDLCEILTAHQGMSRLLIGVNTSCHQAYRQMIDRKFRTEIVGLAMQKPNAPGYNRPDIYVINDWR